MNSWDLESVSDLGTKLLLNYCTADEDFNSFECRSRDPTTFAIWRDGPWE